MRKRKQPGTIIRQYKYSVSTDLRPLPSELWDIAKRMQSAWNALIPLYAVSALLCLNQEYTKAWQAFRESNDEAAYKAAKKLLDARKRETWIAWDKEAYCAIARFALDYSQGPNVIERFNGCIKAGRTCFPETELTHVQIPFFFPGSAAIPVAHLYNNTRRWRIVVEGINDAMFADNRQVSRRERKMCYMELGLSKSLTIALRIDWHRQLPADGIIKRVLLCGKKIPFRGFSWHVLFQVQQPIARTASRSQEAVDLRICWSRFEDSVVVLQWKDSMNREGILAYPLSPTNHADRRTAKRKPEWHDWLLSHRDLASYKALELSLPKSEERRMKMRERRRRVEERWQARRRWIYRNFAAWLVREYALIRLPDLNIKRIAEDDTKEGSLAWADHNRQIAAPGDLLATIKEIAEKHGRRTETYAQTSADFQSLKDSDGLRQMIDNGSIQLFDVQWNSKAVAGMVRAR